MRAGLFASASTSSVASSRISAKARHMNAGPVRGEIGDHRKLAVVHRGAPVDFQMNDAPHPRDAGATERKPNFRLLRLTIGIEPQRALPPPHEPVRRNVDELWRYLGERNGIIRTSVELLLHDLSVVNQKIDVDRTRLEPARPTRSADRKLYVAREARKVLRIELGCAALRQRSSRPALALHRRPRIRKTPIRLGSARAPANAAARLVCLPVDRRGSSRCRREGHAR